MAIKITHRFLPFSLWHRHAHAASYCKRVKEKARGRKGWNTEQPPVSQKNWPGQHMMAMIYRCNIWDAFSWRQRLCWKSRKWQSFCWCRWWCLQSPRSQARLVWEGKLHPHSCPPGFPSKGMCDPVMTHDLFNGPPEPHLSFPTIQLPFSSQGKLEITGKNNLGFLSPPDLCTSCYQHITNPVIEIC